jgi:hypothetical protein
LLDADETRKMDGRQHLVLEEYLLVALKFLVLARP